MSRMMTLVFGIVLVACAGGETEPQLRGPIGQQDRVATDATLLDRDLPPDAGADADEMPPEGERPPEGPIPEDPPEEPETPPEDPPEDPPEEPEDPPEEPEDPPDDPEDPPEEPPEEPIGLAPEPGFTAGWIGGPCVVDEDCDYDEAVCMREDEGFPRGHCTLGCDRFCPDRDGMPVTFCVDDMLADTGACTQRCDFDVFGASGCRPGYRCDLRARFNEAALERGVCVPGAAAATPVDACFAELDELALSFDRREPRLDHPEDHPELSCIVDGPLWLESPVGGVSFRYVTHDESQPIFMSCDLAHALSRLTELLREYDIVEVGHIGTYNCRTIRGTDRLSQHSHGFAIDIQWFRTSDGEVMNVVDHWEHDVVDWETGELGEFETEKGRILYEIGWQMHTRRIFNTVLTPDYNAGHDNHFHVDLYPDRSYIGLHSPEGDVFGPNTHGD